MTKVQNPIIGRSKGSAGGMTFSKNSDQNVMRAKAFEVNNPKTQAQTTQRDFFKEVQSIVDSVSPEQLRSLFGDKPKKMSRRNALFKQVAAAYSVDGNTKSVDFSKLLAIGNGEKVNVPIVKITNGEGNPNVSWSMNEYKKSEGYYTNLICVIFDVSNNKIVLNQALVNTSEMDGSIDGDFFTSIIDGDGYAYLTEPSTPMDGQRSFGSFIIKTRGTTKSSAPAQH